MSRKPAKKTIKSSPSSDQSLLAEQHKIALQRYLHDIKLLPNEPAKTHRFAMLLTELFADANVATNFTRGIEKSILRIDTNRRIRRGRIDSYYGNAVIEFENSLKATLKKAE